MEQKNPGKWAGKPQQFLDYVKKHYAYMDAWKAANSGAEYDPDASEHEAWYDTNQPDIDPDDIKDGRIRMEAAKEAMESVAPEVNRIKADRVIQENAPTIIKNVQRTVMSMVDMVDPEIKKIISGADGNLQFNAEAAARVQSHDPIASRVLERVIIGELQPLIVELELSVIPDSGTILNPAVNQKHAIIDSFRQQAEADLMQSPAEVRIQAGKDFCTIDKMEAMKKNINNASIPAAEKNAKLQELRSKFWTLSIDDLQAVIVNHYAEKAKKQIKDLDSLAQAKYKPSNGGGQPAPNPPPSSAPSTTVIPQHLPTPSTRPTNGKPNAPSSSSSGDATPVNPQGAVPAKTVAEKAADIHFRR